MTPQPADKAIKKVKHDGSLMIATGKSRHEKAWKNVTMEWSELLKRLTKTTRTRETFAQYKKASRDEKQELKDVGGFVGGMIKNGRRKSGQCAWRSMLTLDADFAEATFLEDVEFKFGNAAAVYTTHSHSPDAPKYRLLIPLARPVTPDEYQAIARFIAADIGIEQFDDTTYQPERLMFWPSSSEDAEYIFEYYDAPWLDPDAVLKARPYWTDASTWPESSRAGHRIKKHADKQGDPLEKTGVIGAFCRTYTISQAIETFLDEVYIPTDSPDRYTFAQGSAAGGMITYDDKFAYSHHGTDPAGGQLCNAFDLVRLHRFGIHDEDAAADTQVTKLPSYAEMTKLALNDAAVKIELASTKAAEAMDDFEEDPTETAAAEDTKAWKAGLSYNENGKLLQTIHNALLVLRNDVRLKDKICFDEFTRRELVKGNTPWKKYDGSRPWVDTDDAGLRHYLERAYGLKGREVIQDAVSLIMLENAYHPIKEYLSTLEWDGVPRIDTALIDLLGAEDTAYTRNAMRKWMVAAVARLRNPGCKFDHMLILIGDQGVGKSQFFNRIARQSAWFSDSISRFDNTKESMENLAGKWIIEVGELSGMKRTEVEHIKTFLTKQEDTYRPSYGRRLETFKRQCVFAGTTNRDDFLQDATGNRRFWPIEVKDTTGMWDKLTPDYVDQLWAEADDIYTFGQEDLYLEGEAAEQASETQDLFTEHGGKLGVAGEFLERLLPPKWEHKSMKEKIQWLKGFDFDGEQTDATEPRSYISGIELYVECFNGRPEEYNKTDAHEMTDILTRLKWKKTGERKPIIDYGRQRVFIKK
jgi:putative DNA primase/helicase